MESMTLYHGTAWNFDRFEDFPHFFTPDFKAAEAYARMSSVPVEQWVGMFVIEVVVDVRNYIEITREQFLERFGDIDLQDMESQYFVNELYKPENLQYDGLILRQTRDYMGPGKEGERCQTGVYDQVVVRRPDLLKIVRKIEILPSNAEVA